MSDGHWCTTLDARPYVSAWWRFRCRLGYHVAIMRWRLLTWWYPRPLRSVFSSTRIGDIRQPPSTLFRPSAALIASYREGVLSRATGFDWYMDVDVKIKGGG